MDDNRIKKHHSITYRTTDLYLRKIKKWIYCPVCQDAKMKTDQDNQVWRCEKCGYQLSSEAFKNGYVFWFCDKCGAYLNNQEGYDDSASSHVCVDCGFENQIIEEYGFCKKCGKTLSVSEKRLCTECAEKQKEKKRKTLIVIGKVTGAAIAAAAIGIVLKVVADHSSQEEADSDDLRLEPNTYDDNDEYVFDDYEYDEYDDYEEEYLSIYDAAEIWLSSGMDEGCRFGYSEEELRRALQ